MYNLVERDSYARESVWWVVIPFQRLAWRMDWTLRSHFGKPWVSVSGGNIVARASGDGSGAGVTEVAVMVRTMRLIARVGFPVSRMDATMNSSGITDNEEEVELGLSWVTRGGDTDMDIRGYVAEGDWGGWGHHRLVVLI
jgi:hypothetical protein